MDILGISCHYHDAAAVLLRDGKLVAAAQEERFSRRKHDPTFPGSAVDFCLRRADLSPSEVDYAVFYEKPFLKFERILQSALQTFPRSWEMFGDAMIGWLDEKLWVGDEIQERLGVPRERVLFAEHHLSHAASAFFCSPFEEAAILTVDGVGEWTTAALGTGRCSWQDGARNEIRLHREQRFPHSLGLLYSAFTAWLGFRVNNGEYKVMGMASYGEPRYVDRVREVVDVAPDGSFRLDLDYFSFHYSAERTYTGAFERLFGEARPPDSEFVVPGVAGAGEADAGTLRENQRYADVAASLQEVTESALLRSAETLREQTGQDNLCMAGGVALNSVANGRIIRETDFERVYVQPAASDAGGALGAARYAWHCGLEQPRGEVMGHVFHGEEFTPAAISRFLASRGVEHERPPSREALIDRVASALAGGEVVGWFQGRFEWGPRALGNRSILADPRSAEMRDVVNRKIKLREPFRPFAPVVPADVADQYFEGLERGGPGSPTAPTDFMLAVFPWRDEVRGRVPAVDHRGTGRLQTIRREVQPDYHDLVVRFGEITGTPVLLNTSFNLRGEPIVSTPEQALDTFRKSGLDLLVLEDTVVRAGEGR